MAHGDPADRGGADAYYGRQIDPHYWPEGTYNGTRIERDKMTKTQIDDYLKAYEEQDFFKDWGYE
jgi:hypothetical protein